MIIPQALAVWNVIVARTFFQTTIPDELVEAAEIDGCSDIYFVWNVVLPLSKPIVAVLTLMYAVFHWNAYFDAMIYLNSDRLYPLQIVLRNILILHQDISTMGIRSVREQLMHQGLADLLRYSLIVVGSAPLLAAYPFAQRYFAKGILIGSLKG
jgi:putative aldouronate transport system permease protein